MAPDDLFVSRRFEPVPRSAVKPLVTWKARRRRKLSGHVGPAFGMVRGAGCSGLIMARFNRYNSTTTLKNFYSA